MNDSEEEPKKPRKINLPSYCVPIGTFVNNGDPNCDHDYEEDKYHNEKSDDCRHWTCTKCPCTRCYEIGQ